MSEETLTVKHYAHITQFINFKRVKTPDFDIVAVGYKKIKEGFEDNTPTCGALFIGGRDYLKLKRIYLKEDISIELIESTINRRYMYYTIQDYKRLLTAFEERNLHDLSDAIIRPKDIKDSNKYIKLISNPKFDPSRCIQFNHMTHHFNIIGKKEPIITKFVSCTHLSFGTAELAEEAGEILLKSPYISDIRYDDHFWDDSYAIYPILNIPQGISDKLWNSRLPQFKKNNSIYMLLESVFLSNRKNECCLITKEIEDLLRRRI